ncbi:hypothetical protein Vretimale_19940, partial [Volvox reticuliferus]
MLKTEGPSDGHGHVAFSPTTMNEAKALGFDFGSRPGKLYCAARTGWSPLSRPSMRSPISAKQFKTIFEVMDEEGFSPGMLTNQDKVQRFTHRTYQEDVIPKLKANGVKSAFINKIDAALCSVAEGSSKKQKCAHDNSDTADKPAHRKHSSGITRGKASGLQLLFNTFHHDLAVMTTAADVDTYVVTKDIEKYTTSLGAPDVVRRLFQLQPGATDAEVEERVRKSLKYRVQNRAKWLPNRSLNIETPRYSSFGHDHQEYGKYMGSTSHLDYLQQSIGTSSEGQKYVVVVECKAGNPNAVAAGALLDKSALSKCTRDTDKVGVFIIQLLTTSRAKKIDGPSGPVKLEMPLKKQQINNLPVFCLLPTFDGKDVKTWASFEGCSEKQW